QPGFFRSGVRQRTDVEWVASRNQHALFARGEPDQDGVVKGRLAAYHLNVCVPLWIVYIVEMDRSGDDLATQQAPVSSFAALGQHREPRPTLAQRPLKQGIVTTAHDRRWFG